MMHANLDLVSESRYSGGVSRSSQALEPQGHVERESGRGSAEDGVAVGVMVNRTALRCRRNSGMVIVRSG